MAKIRILIEEKHKILVFLFFAAYLLVGVGIFKDYGISNDEPTERNKGIMAVRYAMFRDQELLTHKDSRHYGTAFEMLLVAIEKILNLTKDPRAIYLMRHLVTFLLFYTGVFFFYRLCKYRFRSWKIGLLGCLFLILSPRIFAHSFYNPKDVPFLAMFIISIYTLTKYLDKKTLPRAAFHAVTCALLIDMRIPGVIVPFFTFIFLIADLLITKTIKIKVKDIAASFLVYTFLLVYFTVLFWPTLWVNSLYHFINAFKFMSHVIWGGTVLYLGEYIKGENLPWHYIPVWIIITTPVLYLACFFMGCFLSIKLLLKNPVQFYISRRCDFIFILWFFLPLVVVILLRSVLYDGWRHMFFIYPAFLILSLAGLTSLYEYIKLRFRRVSYKIVNAGFVLIVSFNLINIAQFMVKYHPHQNVYFNLLAGRDMKQIKKNFELDYWGLSYRKALEYILRNDRNRIIKVCVANWPGKANADILITDDRKRLVYVENPDEAKYFLSNYRWHNDEYPYKDEYYSIKIDGAKIMVVYKMN